jgi:hypothetical protein
MKLEFFRQIFEKYSNIEFHEICLAVAELFHADGQTDRQTDRHRHRQTDRQTERQTDVTKLIIAFHNFAKA